MQMREKQKAASLHPISRKTVQKEGFGPKCGFFLYDWLTAKDWYQTLTGHLHNSVITLLPPESISFFSLSFLNSIIPTRFK